MKIYDISMTIKEDMQVYKNKPEKKPVFQNTANHNIGTSYETKITMDLHTGTHIDAPLHMVKDGPTMEMYNIENYVTKAKVFDLTEIEEKITKADLTQFEISEGDFILFKTRNSFSEEFDFNFIYLDKTGAEYLKEKGIIGVGTDGLGIERAQPNHETHKILLNNNIMIIEGLRLKEIFPGEYTLIALPLKILTTEASPARAILIKE